MTNLTIWTKSFAIAVMERALSTFLQAFISAAGLDAIAIGNTGLNGVNWDVALSISVVSAVLSVIKSVIANIATKDGPSLTHAEQVQPDLPNRPES